MSSEQDNSESEITLKELILKIQEYFREVIKNWWLIGLICVFSTGYFLYKHFKHVPTFTGELRFVVEGQSGVSGGFGGLLGSFGIKNSRGTNPNKILEIGMSSKLFKDVLFMPYLGDSTIAEKLIEEYNLREEWAEKNGSYKDFHFLSKELNTPLEKRAFKSLKRKVWGSSGKRDGALTRISLNEDKGIYSVVTSTTDEHLSIAMTSGFYEGLKVFFEEEVFENQKKSAEILYAKADSINQLRKSKIYELARFEDRNKGVIFRESSTRREILTQEIQVLNAAYSELVKNYEMTDINLKNWQPFFMEIDKPFSPLPLKTSSLLMSLLYGVLSGVFIGTMLVIFRRIFRDIMN